MRQPVQANRNTYPKPSFQGGDMDIHGKVVLVAGASSGIGEATAIMFARRGASVMLAGRREELLRAIVEKLRGEGHSAA